MKLTTQELLEVLSKHFDSETPIDSLTLSSNFFDGEHEKVIGLLMSLTGKGMISIELKETTQCILTEEAENYKISGSPEYITWKYIMKNNSLGKVTTKQNLSADLGTIADIGLQTALKNSWVIINSPEKHITPLELNVSDSCQAQLELIDKAKLAEDSLIEHLNVHFSNSKEILKNLKRRKLIVVKKIKYYSIKKTENFSFEIKEKATDLSAEMLVNDLWKTADFKPYNFFANGKRHSVGSIHPLIQMQQKFKKILISMGFEEMFTSRWVESSFWNFDSLFMPQQHPARDSQDTFFISSPHSSQKETYFNDYSDYIENVRAVHQEGNYGSLGWRSDWSMDEAMKNILRTHTTGCSAHMLYNLCKEYEKTGKFTPRKVFSIDRVFRNETLDATHLAEFHQVEGMVIEEGIGLAGLMGVMKTFYTKLGMPQIRFKPTFNPYTEPSMEIFGYHKALDKWIEVGNSGVFRPEVTETMNIPPNVTVIAWGLSLERPTMIQYGINNIRDLFGAKALLNLPIKL